MIKKFTLFLTISFLASGCSHNKALLFNKINYVKPPVCKMKKIEFKKYKAHIQGNNVLIDEKNLTILIENILIERKENERFSRCLEENNIYYKKVLDIALKQ